MKRLIGLVAVTAACATAAFGSPASAAVTTGAHPLTALAATTRLIDNQTGRCLDSNYNGNVYTLSCNGGNYQNWYGPSGTARIVDNQTGLCLDSNDGGSVYTLGCNGGNYQNWYLYSDATIRDAQTGRCLDSNDGGSVYTLSCNGGNYQKWHLG